MSRINGIPQKEDAVLISHVEDLAYAAFDGSAVKFTDFLDLRQLDVAKGVLKNLGFTDAAAFGGFENAQRNMLCVSQQSVSIEDFPMTCVKISYDSDKQYTHRDFLGSLLGIGIRREKIGDISVFDDCAYAMVSDIILNALLSSFTSVGSSKAKCEISDVIPKNTNCKFMQIRGSVSSLRIDSVVSVALNISRESARSLIQKIGVKLNFREVFSPDAKLFENDVFSVKGYGKYELDKILGYSKKGKTIILINKYI